MVLHLAATFVAYVVDTINYYHITYEHIVLIISFIICILFEQFETNTFCFAIITCLKKCIIYTHGGDKRGVLKAEKKCI